MKPLLSLVFMLALATGMGAESVDPSARELAAIMAERERANNQRFEAQEKAVASALSAAKEAVSKAETAAEKRFDSVNEFRSTLKDQQLTLISRNEADIRFKSIEEKLSTTELRVAQIASKAEGANWAWGVLVGAIGLIIAVGSFIRSRDMARLTKG